MNEEQYRKQMVAGASCENKATLSGGSAAYAAGRMTGRAVLLDRAERLHRQAHQLEALARAIPENFPHDADQALWDLATKS